MADTATGGNGGGSMAPLQETTEQARREAARLAQQAREEASRITHEVSDRARAIVDGEKEAIIRQFDGLAEALKAAQQKLEENQQQTVAHYAAAAADNLQRLSQGLRDADLQTVLQQAENLARRQPVLFLGGAVAAGFLLARFLQSPRGPGRGQRPEPWHQQPQSVGSPMGEGSDRPSTAQPATGAGATAGTKVGENI